VRTHTVNIYFKDGHGYKKGREAALAAHLGDAGDGERQLVGSSSAKTARGKSEPRHEAEKEADKDSEREEELFDPKDDEEQMSDDQDLAADRKAPATSRRTSTLARFATKEKGKTSEQIASDSEGTGSPQLGPRHGSSSSLVPRIRPERQRRGSSPTVPRVSPIHRKQLLLYQRRR